MLTSNKPQNPPLRFKNKSGENYPDWQTKKLGDIADLLRGPFGSSIQKSLCTSSGFKLYEQGNIINNNFSIGSYYIDENRFQMLKKFEIKSNDILITCAGTLGKIAIVPNNIEKGIINSVLMRLRIKSTLIKLQYLYIILNSNIFQNELINKSLGSGIKNMRPGGEIKKVPIPLPSLEEQTKIGDFLKAVDDKIDLQKNKIEKLKNYKTYLMQQLFPQNNQQNPTLRFKHKSGENYPDWETKKLGEIGEFEIGGRPKGGAIDSGIPSIGGEHVDNHFIKKDNMKYVPLSYFNQMKKGVLRNNDILIVKDGVSAGKIGFYKGEYDKACINEHLYVLRTKLYEYFLFNLLLTDKINQKIKSYAVGIISGLNSKIKTIDLFFPPSLEEQTKIGDFLKAVDDKIALQKNKVEKLKNYKTYLMQQLFPST